MNKTTVSSLSVGFAALAVSAACATMGAVVPTAVVPTAASQPLVTPPVYQSANGVLAITIDAQPTRVLLGRSVDRRRDVQWELWRPGAAAPPGRHAEDALRQSPAAGDERPFPRPRRLARGTWRRFHAHGEARRGWDYIIPIPKDHPPGVYWYHTHGHDGRRTAADGWAQWHLGHRGIPGRGAGDEAARRTADGAQGVFAATAAGKLHHVAQAGQRHDRVDQRPGRSR